MNEQIKNAFESIGQAELADCDAHVAEMKDQEVSHLIMMAFDDMTAIN